MIINNWKSYWKPGNAHVAILPIKHHSSRVPGKNQSLQWTALLLGNKYAFATLKLSNRD